MSAVSAWITAALLLVGAIFTLLAAIGVLRMEDVFLRMQATAKASTLGLGCLLLATAVQLSDVASLMRLAVIAAFITVTSPIAAHLVARASLGLRSAIWKGTVINEHPGSGDSRREPFARSEPPSTAEPPSTSEPASTAGRD